jgi:hypothetical protein
MSTCLTWTSNFPNKNRFGTFVALEGERRNTAHMTALELDAIAAQFQLPKRQLSEAWQVLLSHGARPSDADKQIRQMCEDSRAQGGGIAMFDKLLKGQVSVLKASQPSP